MDYLRIRNWDRWQCYRKDRGQPPWIKVHRAVMRNPEWVSMSDSERGQLVAMWLLAADKDGSIPSSPEMIQKICFMTKAPNINRFTELGFIDDEWRHSGCQDDANVTPTWRQDDANVTPQSRVDKSREDKNNILSLGSLGNVRLSEYELDKLKEKFGEVGAGDRIEKLDMYIASKGKKYKSHYATILMWASKEVNTDGNTGRDKGDANLFLQYLQSQNDRRASSGVDTSSIEIQRRQGTQGGVVGHGRDGEDADSCRHSGPDKRVESCDLGNGLQRNDDQLQPLRES